MFSRAYNQLRQLYPGKPHFTEANLPDLSGKVYLVTGANTGIGKDLSKILYSRNATVWVAARSEEKAQAAIASIRDALPLSTGSLTFLHLDLADLSTIKPAAERFLAAESRLNVLFNNAGVMMPPADARTAQGYELQLGVNNVGPFLLTRLLAPILSSTAAASPANETRIVWVASSAADAPIGPTHGVDMDNLDFAKDKSDLYKYMHSKAGNVLHCAEFGRRLRADGVVSVSLNPGNLNSDLWRNQGRLTGLFLRTFVLHPSINGAYTELFAGLSPDVKLDYPGDWIVPWGRFTAIRPTLANACKSVEEGGSGTALEFWDWSEKQVKPFM